MSKKNVFPSFMVISAFRYCLSKEESKYEDMAQWIKTYWMQLEPFTRQIILNEIEGAMQFHELRSEKADQTWQSVLDFAKKSSGLM